MSWYCGAQAGNLPGATFFTTSWCRPSLTEHGTKQQLRRLADDLQDLRERGDSGHAHHDVLALEVDRGPRDAQAVHPIVQDRRHLLHVGVRRLGGGFVDDREPAREVKARLGSPSQRQRRAASDPKAIAMVSMRLTISDRREPTCGGITSRHLLSVCRRRRRSIRGGHGRVVATRNRRGDEVQFDPALGAQGDQVLSSLRTTVPTKPPMVWARSPTSHLAPLGAGPSGGSTRAHVEEVEGAEHHHVDEMR